MPRIQPPEGFLTSTQVCQELGISDTMLSRYVKNGKLKRHGRFYKREELDTFKANIAGQTYHKHQWRQNPSSTFRLATEADMPAIMDISVRTFGNEEGIPSLNTRLGWLHKNPETFFVIVNQQSLLIAYATVLPLPPEIIQRLIHDEVTANDIRSEDVALYMPDRSHHLYAMSLVVDPTCSKAEMRRYGARLESGLFRFLKELAARGIEIETITARSHTPDGLRQLRKMGFPKLRSPVPGKHLFIVQVAKSGLHALEEYSAILERWKKFHK